MGKYINETSLGLVGTSALEKCNALLSDGALEIREPKIFVQNIVCVVDNGFFGAAAYAYNEEELNIFRQPDNRSKRWFVRDKAKQFAK